MRQLILLLILLGFAGCKAPVFVEHSAPPTQTHEIIEEKTVTVDVPVVIPETNHYGEITAPEGADIKEVWDWPEAATTLEVVHGRTTDHGLDGVVKLGNTTYRVSTKVKAREYVEPTVITFSDTTNLLTVRYAGVDSVFLVTDTTKEFLYTVTNDYQPCAEDIPPLPAPGSPWWKWPLYAIGIIMLLLGVGRRKTANRNPQTA